MLIKTLICFQSEQTHFNVEDGINDTQYATFTQKAVRDAPQQFHTVGALVFTTMCVTNVYNARYWK